MKTFHPKQRALLLLYFPSSTYFFSVPLISLLLLICANVIKIKTNTKIFLLDFSFILSNRYPQTTLKCMEFYKFVCIQKHLVLNKIFLCFFHLLFTFLFFLPLIFRLTHDLYHKKFIV